MTIRAGVYIITVLALGCGWSSSPSTTSSRVSLRFIADDPRGLFDPSSLISREQIVAEWDFDGDDLRGWRVLPDPSSTAKPHTGEMTTDGIELPVDRKVVRVDRLVDFDSQDVDLITVILESRKPIRKPERWLTSLRWAARDQVPSSSDGSGKGLRAFLKKGSPGAEVIVQGHPLTSQTMVFRFHVGGRDDWQGSIRYLLFDLRPRRYNGGAILRRVVASSVTLDDQRLRDLTFNGCKIEIGSTVRNAIPALPGFPVQRRLEIAPGSRLRFGYGVPADLASGAGFRVSIDIGSGPEVLFTAQVDANDRGRWHEATVELDRFAGHRGSLRLEATSERRQRFAAGFPVWAEPEVRAPVPVNGSSSDNNRFNFVIISLDTLRADHLSLYGYHRETSPNLDRLAAQSVVFDIAIAQAPMTLSSHHSLFQSRYPSKLQDDSPKLAGLLRAAGYRTAAFTGGGYVSSKLGFADGFDLYAEDRGGFSDSFERIESWIRRSVREPFFLFVHTYDIHTPYDPRAPFDRLFDADYEGPVTGRLTTEIVLAALAKTHPRGNVTGSALRPEITRLLPLSAADLGRLVALYDGGVRETDVFIGRLIALLSELGILETTAIAVFSDHGEEFWDHNSLGHSGTLYQEAIRVPLILRLPGARRGGTRVPQVVRLMDLAPTLTGLAGLSPHPDFQGRSLLPLINGEQVAHVSAVSEMSRVKSLVDPPWKLIFDQRTKRTELFDLRSDPGEHHDVAEQYPEEIRRLVTELERLLAGAGEAVDHDPNEVHDEALREQLRALGYLQ